METPRGRRYGPAMTDTSVRVPVGPLLRDWRRRGAIPRRAKMMAFAGILAGYVLFWLGSNPGPLLATGVAAFMLTGLAYVLTRPS